MELKMRWRRKTMPMMKTRTTRKMRLLAARRVSTRQCGRRADAPIRQTLATARRMRRTET